MLNDIPTIQTIKDLKADVTNMLQQSIANSLETNEDVENLSKETDIIKKKKKKETGENTINQSFLTELPDPALVALWPERSVKM